MLIPGWYLLMNIIRNNDVTSILNQQVLCNLCTGKLIRKASNPDHSFYKLFIMKRNFVKALLLSSIGIFFLSLLAGFSLQQQEPWKVPDNYKKMKNPVASNSSSVSEGKSLYATHCRSCHGSKGLGDGNKAAQLKTDPGDFSADNFQSQSDGALFYKTTEGRGDMPSFKKKIPDEDERWSIVNFLRTLKK